MSWRFALTIPEPGRCAFDVVGFGENSVDLLAVVAEHPAVNSKQRLQRSMRLPGGQIAFFGRVDNQMKIRGYRIEPDEIAAVLNSYPGVTTSVVTALADNGEDKRLVAYVVAKEGLTRNGLQEFLLKRLPDYMVPSTFVLIDDFPFTSNGKVDCADTDCQPAYVCGSTPAGWRRELPPDIGGAFTV